MPRSRPALKLERNPLIVVLVQARISPILSLVDYIPNLQNRLRAFGYPRFAETRMREFPLGVADLEPRWQSKYSFQGKDGRRAVVISPDFVTLEVTRYESFESFLGEWEAILRLVAEVLQPDLVERVGLRYIDLIQPREDEDLDRWLRPSLIGLPGLPLTNVRSQMQVQGTSTVGELIVRATRPTLGIVPMDLQPFELEVTTPTDLRPGNYAILDFDHFSTASHDFELPWVLDITWQLHDLVDLAFRSAVTEEAFRAWGSES